MNAANSIGITICVTPPPRLPQPAVVAFAARALDGLEDFERGVFAYQVGYFNGVNDGQSSDNLATPDVEVDTEGDYAARVFFQPFINSEKLPRKSRTFRFGDSNRRCRVSVRES